MSRAVVYENSVKFKMAAISKRSQIFKIGENSVKLQSLLFHLSPHLDHYVLPVLRIASEFVVCPRCDDADADADATIVMAI